MSVNQENVLCLRCKSEMEHSNIVYAIPESRNSSQSDNKVNLTKAIPIQILRCSNPECDFIELKAPKHWPSSIPSKT
jgi:hypothetical protein